jgi:Outer membrane protein beta-barrel domain
LRKLSLMAVLGLLFVMQTNAFGQQFDAALGVGGLTAPSGTVTQGGSTTISQRGGAYPAFSADVLLKHNFGVGGELAWRASRNLYGGFQPYRPLFYDFNGIYAPKLGKHFEPEVMAGIGWESLRFYTPTFHCNFITCTDYFSSNHFMGHIGAGIRYYVWGHLFIRPEAHLYLIHNNVEFPSAQAARFGMSIGYTFAPGF